MRSLLIPLALLSSAPAALATPAEEAAAIHQLAGLPGGFAVHVGAGDASLTAALHTSDAWQVQGLEADESAVTADRQRLEKAGTYGPVSVESWTPGSGLPYLENLVNLLVIEDAATVSEDEIQRVLTPRGVALVRQGDSWKKIVKPWPKAMDEWTHYFYNAAGNPTSQDTLVGPPSRLQWVGSPRWSRHHDRISSVNAMVSGGGRLYYIMDEGSRISILLPSKYALIARDAFNGTVLWKKPITKWNTHLWPLKSGPTQLTRRLVSDGDDIFVTLAIDAPISRLNGGTGALVTEYPETAGAEEIAFADGMLYAIVNTEPWRLNEEFAVQAQSDQKRVETEFNWDGKDRHLIALDPDSGKVLWRKTLPVAPVTFITDGQRAVFHNGHGLVCLDAKTGEEKWSDENAKTRQLYEFNYGPRVILNQKTLLYAGGDGSMKGIDADTGAELWNAPHEKSGYRSPEDLIVAQGLVWNAGTLSGSQTGEYTGRDPRTGEIRKQFIPDVPEGTYWFHHRCYLAKATENYIIPSRTGIEYVDVAKQSWDLNHWVRGACLYGVLPANGLTYAGPHNCACYPEAKLDGMNALAPASRQPEPPAVPDEQRLVKGPAYDQPVTETETTREDWPTYRGNNARSGSNGSELTGSLDTAWQVDLGGPLSTTTSADGKVFVSKIDAHTLLALDLKTGRTLWQYTAGGRIDSPPTYWKGRVLFGCRDGWAYCLRASDGALIWKFLGAKNHLHHFAWEQLESVWPIHGSVLVENDLVSFVAGRSCFLNDGLWFYRLDPRTGEIRVKQHYDDRDPETGGELQDRHKTLQMPVASNDILSSDGHWTYLRTQKIAADGTRVEIGPVSGDFAKQGGAQKGEGQHLFSPTGFLDDSYFHRSYWVYGKSFAGGHGGYYQAGKYAPAGRILVHDDDTVYSYGRESKYYKWTTTMEHTLYATKKDASDAAYTHDEALTERVGNALTSKSTSGTTTTPPPEGKEKGAAKGKAGPKAKGKGKAKGTNSVAALSNAVTFPASDRIDLAGKPLTVEVWAMPDQKSGVLVQDGGPQQGFSLELGAKGKPQFHLRINSEAFSLIAPKPLEDGWHHLAATLAADGTTRLFVDGLPVAEGKASGVIPSTPKRPLLLGNPNGSGVNPDNAGSYQGLLDQFVLHLRALSPEEIDQRFSHPEERPEDAALVVSFDNGDSRDDSGGSTHGVGSGVESGKGKVAAAIWFKGGPAGAKGKPAGGGSFVQHDWDRYVPLIARSMTLAGNTLLVSGPPDLVDEEYAFERLAARDPAIQKELAEQDAALDGKRGAHMWAVNTQTGEQSGGIELTSPPVWDGLAVNHGQLLIATQDGKLTCYRSK
ncbi:MAG: PQQ-binding-like beta-propeller repeat protein [Verrucomicrobiales bacterium]|nr:PQQ-binding-like beta-propeller repeat protein [Verrucomicrobiales bacterium]